MVLPAAVRKVAEEIEKNDLQLPKNGDIFLMEWPNEEFDHFRITFLEPGCAAHAKAVLAYEQAIQSNRLMGGSCGLEKGISPDW